MYVLECVYIVLLSPFNRALELAVKHKTHVDTVLAFRQKYLRDLNTEESLKKFKQYSQQVGTSQTPHSRDMQTHTHSCVPSHTHT